MTDHFSLEEVVDLTVDDFIDPAHAKGIQITAHICPDVCSKFMGDSRVLKQILIELLSNALKYTSTGQIRVNVEPDMENKALGALHFLVSDTGCGISSEKQKQIFEPCKPENTGSGEHSKSKTRGLVATKHMVNQIGGSIGVESTIGRGSTFFFTANYDIKSCGGHCST